MKKTLILLLAVLALFVSCNLDADRGIFDKIDDAVPQDSNFISDLVGRYGEGTEASPYHYVFNTSKGIALDDHTNVIITNDNAKMMVKAIAVDQQGNILVSIDNKVSGKTEFKVWNAAEKKLTEDSASIAGTVYLSANFHDNAYDVVVKNETGLTYYWTDDLVQLLGAGRTTWNNTTIEIPENQTLRLVGNGAYIFTSKDGLKDEERVIYKAQNGKAPLTLDYFRNKDLTNSVPMYLMDDLYVFGGKLYNGNDEITKPNAETPDKPYSLNMSGFAYTIEGGKITGTDLSNGGKVRMFQYDASGLRIQDQDVDAKRILGFRNNGADKYNFVLVGDYDYEKEIKF